MSLLKEKGNFDLINTSSMLCWSSLYSYVINIWGT